MDQLDVSALVEPFHINNSFLALAFAVVFNLRVHKKLRVRFNTIGVVDFRTGCEFND
jgi:hypothetical protein